MDEIIKEIIKIDRKTIDIKEKYEGIIKEKEAELREALQKLENEYKEISTHEDTLNTTDSITNELENLEKLCAKNIANMDKTYNNLKNNLVEDIWKELILSKEGI